MAKQGRQKGLLKGQTTLNQKTFAIYYAQPGTDQFGNAFLSYKKAYNTPDSKDRSTMSSACTLLKNPKVIKLIETYVPKNIEKQAKITEIKKEYALTKHQELYNRAFTDHDNTSCVALLRMYWQAAGLLSERLVIDVHDSRRLDTEFQKEAKRIASIVLETQGLPDHAPDHKALPGFDAAFNDVSEQFLEPPPAIETPQDIVVPYEEDETISGTDFLSDDD